VPRVAIVGASGYVGGELIRLALNHPEIDLGALMGNASAGTTIGANHRHLPTVAAAEIQATDVQQLQDHDVVFIALPHGESAALVNQIGSDVRILDCGADFRIRNEAEWNKFYNSPHAGCWPYGLPELPGVRDELRQASRIAVPGCYPTATTLALAPALMNGLVKSDVVVVAASGTSGAGRSPKVDLLAAEVTGSMSTYGVGGSHRHTPEIRQNLARLAGAGIDTMNVSFTPMLAPMARGILVTASAPLAVATATEEARLIYRKTYDNEPFVHLLAEDCWPTTGATLGSNSVHVQVAVDQAAQRLVAVAAIDNLIKGSAGAAVQNMNLMCGFPETMGLSANGLAP
jgi:N-acetyl-gamma-glutamyl-phosphate reductase